MDNTLKSPPPTTIIISPIYYKTISICIVCFGLALRAQHWLLDRSLWLDESFLSLAILKRSLSNLLILPLPYEQTPPPLFMMLVKILADICNPSEIVLRAIPFVSSCMTLCLLPFLTSKHSRFCLMAGTFFLAISYSGVYYASEFKPYSTEALLTVLFVFAGINFIRLEINKQIVAYMLLFAFAPWLGFSTLFMLTGLTGAMLFAMYGSAPVWRSSVCGLLALGYLSFLCMYACYALPASATQMHMEYWKEFQAPVQFSAHTVAWYGERASQVLSHFFGLQDTWKGAVLSGAAFWGAYALFRRDPPYALVLILPIMGAVLLSMLGMFPLHERLLVFLLPVCCLLLAEGALALGGLLKRLGPAATVAPMAVLLAVLARPVALEVFDASIFERQEFKRLSGQIVQRCSDKDTVFVFQAAIPLYEYYGHRDARIQRFEPLSIIRGDTASLQDAIRKVREAGRGWVLFVHVQRTEEQLLEETFASSGELRERLTAPGAWAFRFEVENHASSAAAGQTLGTLTR